MGRVLNSRCGGSASFHSFTKRYMGDFCADSITEGQSFVDDLGAASMELIELVDKIEYEFGERSIGLRIEDEALEDLKTVRDAVDYVFDLVAAAG